MKSQSLLLAFFLSLATSGIAIPDHILTDLDRARKAYDREEYEKALELYQKVEEDHRSPSLYYNMGNAALRTEALGKAILYYQKARKRAPWDPDIQNNLELALDRTRDEFDREPVRGIGGAFKDLLVAAPIGGWWVLSMICSCLCGLSFFLIASYPVGKRLGAWTIMILFLFLTGLFFAADRIKHRILEQKNSAVIMTPSARVKSSPKMGTSTAFVLHEGTCVELRKKNGEWSEIRTPDQQVGWVRSDRIALY